MVIDAINVPTAAQLAGYFPGVPQPGTITLTGRDSRLLVANYAFGGQQLVYSTSEFMTQATIGASDRAAVRPGGHRRRDRAAVRQPATVNVLSGTVRATWDPSRGDLRLDYVHNGLAKVEITGGGTTPLLLLIADTNTAEEFWPESTSAGPVLVERRLPGQDGAERPGPRSRSPATPRGGHAHRLGTGRDQYVTWNGQPVGRPRARTVPSTATSPARAGHPAAR